MVEESSKLNTGVGGLCLKLGFSLIPALLDDSSQAMEDIFFVAGEKRGSSGMALARSTTSAPSETSHCPLSLPGWGHKASVPSCLIGAS